MSTHIVFPENFTGGVGLNHSLYVNSATTTLSRLDSDQTPPPHHVFLFFIGISEFIIDAKICNFYIKDYTNRCLELTG